MVVLHMVLLYENFTCSIHGLLLYCTNYTNQFRHVRRAEGWLLLKPGLKPNLLKKNTPPDSKANIKWTTWSPHFFRVSVLVDRLDCPNCVEIRFVDLLQITVPLYIVTGYIKGDVHLYSYWVY